MWLNDCKLMTKKDKLLMFFATRVIKLNRYDTGINRKLRKGNIAIINVEIIKQMNEIWKIGMQTMFAIIVNNETCPK